MKELMKKRLNQKGLTLIELLAVIVILAIIAAIAIPAIASVIQKQNDKAVLSDAQLIISAAKLAAADGACTSETKCLASELTEYLDDVKGFNGTNDTVEKTANGWKINWESSNYTFKKITGATVKGATEGDLQGWMKK